MDLIDENVTLSGSDEKASADIAPETLDDGRSDDCLQMLPEEIPNAAAVQPNQNSTTTGSISSLLSPCKEHAKISRRHHQKRRTFGVASSSELDDASNIATTTTCAPHSIALPVVDPIQDEITHNGNLESLWNNDIGANEEENEMSTSSLLSLDDEEDMGETTFGSNAKTWLSTEAPSTSMMMPTVLPSDLLMPSRSITTPTSIVDTTTATDTQKETPNSVSAPNTDDEHDSFNGDTNGPTSPDIIRGLPITTTRTSTPTKMSTFVPLTEGQSLNEYDNGDDGPSDSISEETVPSPENGENAKPPDDMEDILASTEAVFEQVTDKTTVTVKDILQSLAAEYSHVTFTKAMKSSIRSRLVELITASAPPEVQDSDDDDDEEDDGNNNAANVQSDIGDSDHSDSDESDAVVDSDHEPSDDEEFTTKSKKKSRSSKTLKATKLAGGSKKSRQQRPNKKPSAASAKLSLRVHAEQRRKRRLEELRVRNEELLLHQNAIDRERAEQIAAKFATNTDELRQERFEQRMTLLQKLNHKRINACSSTIAITTSATTMEQSAKIEAKDIATVAANLDNVILENTSENTHASVDIDKLQVDANDDNSDASDFDDEDDELEIVGRPPMMKPPAQPTNTIQKDTVFMPPSSTGAMALLDLADNNQLTKRHGSKTGMLSPGRNMDQRALLREKLKERQRALGNRWLARELGYKTEEEHLEVCLAEENMKRERIYRKEQERIEANERAAERMMNTIDEQGEDDGQDGELNVDGKDDHDIDDENNDDEEMEMARELEKQIASDVANNDDENEGLVGNNGISEAKKDTPELGLDRTDEEDVPSNDGCADVEGNADDSLAGIEASNDGHNTEDDCETAVEQQNPSDQGDSTSIRQMNSANDDESNPDVPTDTFRDNDKDPVGEDSRDTTNETVDDDPAEDINDTETADEESKPKGPRNKAWQAMLQKDAEKAKKKKRSQLIEEEADEEEEEEVAGLEDFGFVVHKKKSDDDDDVDLGDFNEDDLEHVVDDLSDDEGDELAGDKARKAMDAKEEKDRHKEMLRRMRDGYDGRRGGIAGGTGGARGFHRFDQLVAADNREDAKLLGLLNDDEIDSDNEGEGVEKSADNDEDDEHVLLDKMLKARFLHRSTVDEENFSDDDADEDNNDVVEDGDGTAKNKEDEEEQEQDRLAKRFAKRARMQRLIEVHGHEAEFSESKLIDDDTTLKLELQQMKNGLIRKHSDLTTSNSWHPMNSSLSTMNSRSQLHNKKQKTGPNNATFATSLLSKGGSLAIALQANRKSNKARTSFVSTSTKGTGTGTSGSSSGLSTAASSSFQKCIAFNHVVFHSSSNSNTANGSSSSRSKGTKPGFGGSNTLHKTTEKFQNITNNSRMGGTKVVSSVSSGIYVSSRQDSLFSKLPHTGNHGKRKL